jgi:hypothetical protein
VATQTLAAQIEASVAQRIAEADAEAHESSVAFAAGKFEEHFQRKTQATAKGISDEYARIAGQAADRGDGQAGC